MIEYSFVLGIGILTGMNRMWEMKEKSGRTVAVRGIQETYLMLKTGSENLL